MPADGPHGWIQPKSQWTSMQSRVPLNYVGHICGDFVYQVRCKSCIRLCPADAPDPDLPSPKDAD